MKPKTVAERMKWLRSEKLGVPLQVFANEIGFSKAYVHQIETGLRSNPSEEFLSKVVDAFSVNYEWLATGAGVPGDVKIKASSQALPMSEQFRRYTTEDLEEWIVDGKWLRNLRTEPGFWPVERIVVVDVFID